MAPILTVQRMSAPELADRMYHGSASLAVIDVRDSDYIGGHIRGSMHFASASFDVMLPTLLRTLQNVQTVVFHCAQSQQRGPGAAQMYLREVAAQQTRGRSGVFPAVPQTVYVLDGGFVSWQQIYGQDTFLTEGYRRELWRYY
ncbi:Cdc25 phosphatase Ibp1 [Sporothrix epigloea]|uniref:Cdc25 phosphatase Ibp1 n=1 Tax=Sporothrix epigloea TaxID=1892477 RepID=A0ABP0DHT8_9PEZI